MLLNALIYQAIILLFALLGTLVQAESVYVYQKNGTLSFSDEPPSIEKYEVKTFSQPKALLKNALQASPKAVPTSTSEVRRIIGKIAPKHNVEPALIEAVVKAESAYNHRAVSRKGARGLMQLMPSTARALGVINSFDPVQNIEGGTRLLNELLTRYQDLNLALAAYNAGDEAVKKYKGVPPYRETIDYISKVRHYYKRFVESNYYQRVSQITQGL